MTEEATPRTKKLTPEEIADIIALRQVGYTINQIADKVGTSKTTVQTHLKSANIEKGTKLAEIVQSQLNVEVEALYSQDKHNETITRQLKLASDFSLKTADILEDCLNTLETSNDLDAINLTMAKLRAVNQASTAIKNTNDTIDKIIKSPAIADNLSYGSHYFESEQEKERKEEMASKSIDDLLKDFTL